MSTSIQIKYDSGCMSIRIPDFFHEATRAHQRKFYKLAAQHRTDCPENRENVTELLAALDDAIAEAEKEAKKCDGLAEEAQDKKSAKDEARRANNRLKALQQAKADLIAALEKYQ